MHNSLHMYITNRC